MTLEQYLNIYDRTKKTAGPQEAALTVFRALNREVTYGIANKGQNVQNALYHANTIWCFLSSANQEINPDGFKELSRLYAEKSTDARIKQEILVILDTLS